MQAVAKITNPTSIQSSDKHLCDRLLQWLDEIKRLYEAISPPHDAMDAKAHNLQSLDQNASLANVLRETLNPNSTGEKPSRRMVQESLELQVQTLQSEAENLKKENEALRQANAALKAKDVETRQMHMQLQMQESQH